VVLFERGYALVLFAGTALSIASFVALLVLHLIWPYAENLSASMNVMLAVMSQMGKSWPLLVLLAIPLTYSPLRKSLFYAHNILRSWGPGTRAGEGESKAPPQ
jgi:hypothetical protein